MECWDLKDNREKKLFVRIVLASFCVEQGKPKGECLVIFAYNCYLCYCFLI